MEPNCPSPLQGPQHKRRVHTVQFLLRSCSIARDNPQKQLLCPGIMPIDFIIILILGIMVSGYPMCSGGESNPWAPSQERMTMHARPLLVGRWTYIVRFIYFLVLSRPIVWKCCTRQIVPLLYWHCQKRHQKKCLDFFVGLFPVVSTSFRTLLSTVYMTVMSSTDLAK